MVQTICIDGSRPLEADLQTTDSDDGIVVACPPHPQFGGSRTDRRLMAVGDRLTSEANDCLRFDYGPWDGGRGDRGDVLDAIAWASTRYLAVGVFGYSFGATMAIFGTKFSDRDVSALSVLVPSVEVADRADLDVLGAFRNLPCDAQVIYGERDRTVQWEPLVNAGEQIGDELVPIAADHFFIDRDELIGEAVATFFKSRLLV